MENIKFVPLSDIEKNQVMNLMNNHLVKKHLPLLKGTFSSEHYHNFIQSKQDLWRKHGFGPWGFLINGNFAGWGGLQPEQGEADFALVLHPDFWGWGKRIFDKVKEHAFSEMKLNSITILLPPDRPNSKAVIRMGFQQDGISMINNDHFLRFRLLNPTK